MPLSARVTAPTFSLSDQDGKLHSLADYRGSWVVLYFYPKDDTPGCTKETCSFRDNLPHFKDLKAQVFGISADSVKSHKKFAEKFQVSFPLLSDESKETIHAYGVWGKKKFMGREYDGILRTTFIINPQGEIARVFENVKPEGHAEEVMRAISS